MTEPKELSAEGINWHLSNLKPHDPGALSHLRIRSHIAALEAKLAERDALVRELMQFLPASGHPESLVARLESTARKLGIIEE